ncbi:hypothetical protein US8_00915 [Bacillus altitudinis]|nr:hypothetical protein US8_00915 [Bacillus altitudinis]
MLVADGLKASTFFSKTQDERIYKHFTCDIDPFFVQWE